VARGWESKSVESQMEAAAAGKARAQAVKIDAVEAERLRQRESLILSRTRVLHDLKHAQNPGYRDILTAALKHLDDKLSKLA